MQRRGQILSDFGRCPEIQVHGMLCVRADATCALGDPNPRIRGRCTPRSPAGKVGWGSWGSALPGRGLQLLDDSWRWSCQHRGCRAELRCMFFGAGWPCREQRTQSPAQRGALASRGGLSSSTGGKCRVWHPPTVKYRSRLFLLLLPACSDALGKLTSLHIGEREFAFWHEDVFSPLRGVICSH